MKKMYIAKYVFPKDKCHKADLERNGTWWIDDKQNLQQSVEANLLPFITESGSTQTSSQAFSPSWEFHSSNGCVPFLLLNASAHITWLLNIPFRTIRFRSILLHISLFLSLSLCVCVCVCVYRHTHGALRFTDFYICMNVYITYMSRTWPIGMPMP